MITTEHLKLKSHSIGVGEMDPCFKTLAARPEDLSLTVSTCLASHDNLELQFQCVQHPFFPLQALHVSGAQT